MAAKLKLDSSLMAERLPVDSLPVVDFEGFLRGSASDRQAVAMRVAAACQQVGFFYVTGHGIPGQVISRAFQESGAFFALPAEAKGEVGMGKSKARGGWRDISSAPSDSFNESYRMGLLADEDSSVPAGTPVTADNLWPSQPTGFKSSMRAYIEAVEALAHEILRAMAISLELPESYFEKWFKDRMGQLKALRYPSQEGEVNQTQIGSEEHTDIGAITILAQDDHGGLQVRNVDGVWLDVTPIPGSFVVNIGDLMARWTNDVFSSTLHRVVNVSGFERYSLAFFREPDHDTIVECIPSCIEASGTVKYPRISSAEYLKWRVQKRYQANEDGK